MRLSRLARTIALASGAAAALAWARPAHAQGTAVIRGTVVDSTNQLPVASAQVSIAGSVLGGLTNAGGEFVLARVPAGTHTVRIQRLGYRLVERQVTLAANDTAQIRVAMPVAAVELSAVVSVGYGTSSRRDVSSAVATVQAEQIANTPVAGLDAALQGKAPGVQIVQNAGNPGVGITVRVRGAASLSASNQPLYVIDGVPMIRENYAQLDVGGQDITAVTSISPDEIESIDILKDAAAAAIYGSRGSNGVVMITTKRGRSGATRFTINAYTGTQEATKTMDMLNGAEYVEYMNEARVNSGRTPRYTPGTHDAISTDWQNSVLRSSPVSDIFASVDGGSDRMRYLLSGSYFNQEGIVIGSGYDRQTLRANVDFDATSRLSFRSSLNLSREVHDRIENDNTIEGVYANAIAEPPIFPVYQPDGSFTDRNDRIGVAGFTQRLSYVNPVAVGTYNDWEARNLRALGNIEGVLSITDAFRLTSRVALDVLNLRELEWNSPLIIGAYAEGAEGVAKQGNNTAHRYVLESFLNYNHAASFGGLSWTGGASVEYNESELDFIRGEGFAFPRPQYVRNAGKVTVYDGDRTGNNLVSFFSRADASLHDRYLLTASIRADGSSRFGEDNRYGIFPAVSLGWIMSEEAFMAGVPAVSELKLRGSYGTTGNQGIGDDFAPIGRYTRANYGDTPGIGPYRLGNPELKWETTREIDLGFDLGLFDSRLTVIGDWYHKKTEDLLVQRPITRTTGFASIWDNVGNIENKGIELGLSTMNFRSTDPMGFEWRSDFNISWNRNEVTKLFDDQPFNSGFDDINRIEVGEELGAYYTLKFLGVDPATGDAMFLDADGDGEQGNSGDRVIVGSPHPDYFGGFTNTVNFRGFDLRAFVQFSQGASLYNGIRAYADDGGVNSDNKFQNVMDRWQSAGDVTDEPRAEADCSSGACIVSSRYIEDASYVRLQEVTIGYRLPAMIARNARFSEARIYLSGRNLKTWTDFTGLNPEANSSGSSANTSLGTEFYTYPLARTFTLGVSGSW